MNHRQFLFNKLQSLLPQQWLSRCMYHMTRWTWRPWKNLQIRWFIRRFGVDMQEAEFEYASDYPHFNAFFTRALKTGIRPEPSDADAIISPVDGRISRSGNIDQNTLIQAKGHQYTVPDLLATRDNLATEFHDGHYFTIYLSPRDYHRIHMPCDGRLQRMIHVPGCRFAVNETSVAGIPNLFARNERVVNIFMTSSGPMALIMVGALFVGSMETVWTDTMAARQSGEPGDYDYRNARIHLRRGIEMGRFNMGSTVILLFPRDRIDRDYSLQSNQTIRLGETLAHFRNN